MEIISFYLLVNVILIKKFEKNVLISMCGMVNGYQFLFGNDESCFAKDEYG